MNIKLQYQKNQMLTAINCLELIEVCEKNIKLNNDIEIYKVKKDTYVSAYADVLSNILKDAIKLSKFEIFE